MLAYSWAKSFNTKPLFYKKVLNISFKFDKLVIYQILYQKQKTEWGKASLLFSLVMLWLPGCWGSLPLPCSTRRGLPPSCQPGKRSKLQIRGVVSTEWVSHTTTKVEKSSWTTVSWGPSGTVIIIIPSLMAFLKANLMASPTYFIKNPFVKLYLIAKDIPDSTHMPISGSRKSYFRVKIHVQHGNIGSSAIIECRRKVVCWHWSSKSTGNWPQGNPQCAPSLNIKWNVD